MKDQDLQEKINARFDYLFGAELLEELGHVGQTRRVREGNTIMEPGQAIDFMPFLLDGSLKVMRADKEGQELLLYYLEAGDTCAMSLSCCMGAKKSKIKAVAEEDTLLLMVPVRYLEGWICKFPEWKAYIFDMFRVRMEEFIETIDSLAFMRMDERLLKYLRDRVRVTGRVELETTHHEIAADLNSSRVVISRLMKQLENQKLVRQHRNRVEVLSL